MDFTTKQLKINRLMSFIRSNNITGYEIEQKTQGKITEVGVNKIINGKTKSPQNSTIEILENFLKENYGYNLTLHTECLSKPLGIKDRIKNLIKTFADGNNSKFASAIGTNEANVRNYLNGAQPKLDVIAKIYDTFELNYEWLLTGRGEMLKERECKKVHEIKNSNPTIVSEPDITGRNIESVKQEYEEKIRLLKERLSDKEDIIASKDQMLSMKDEVIKLKEEALKRNQEIIKEKDDFIATQKAYIENLKKKESIIDALEIPHSKKVTFVKKGNTTEITEIKKGWPDGRNADITLPIQNT